MRFQEFFQHYGDQLVVGYQRAQADGTDETARQWILGEHHYYLDLDHHTEYEVPYHGLWDR